MPGVWRRTEGIERCCRAGGAAVAKMAHATDKRVDRAESGVAAAAVTTKCFTANPILLGCESNGDERRGKEIGDGTCEGIKAPVANPDACILQAEEVVSRCTGQAAVLLARAEKEIIGQEEAIARGGKTRRRWLRGGQLAGLAHH